MIRWNSVINLSYSCAYACVILRTDLFLTFLLVCRALYINCALYKIKVPVISNE